MNNPIFFDSKNSLSLFGLDKNFEFISKIYSNQNLPRVIMFSGNKGSGKATLINHFLYSIFDIENYDLEKICLPKTLELINDILEGKDGS